MTELYPLVEDGRLAGAIGSGGDATLVCRLGGGCRRYFWLSRDEALEASGLLDRRGLIRIEAPGGLGVAPVSSWLRSPPLVYARAAPDLGEYARMLARMVGRELRGKTVLLGFSGGKDSIAALLVLQALQDRVPFRLRVVYVHIPFLESPRSVEFVERVSEKLGVPVEVLEAPRREFKTLLKWKGLPRRGYRWCTMYKARPMRRIRREDPRVVEVVGDRLTESPKRMERLSRAAAARVVLAGRTFRPTYLLTIVDVVELAKQAGLVHPDYLDGIPRVACAICPFKPLPEYRRLPPLEDPELLEKVYEKTWRKWYSWASYEEFLEEHLWRFDSRTAKSVHLARKALRDAQGERLGAEWVEEAYRRVWTQPLPRAPELEDPWEAAEHALRASRRGRLVVVPGQQE